MKHFPKHLSFLPHRFCFMGMEGPSDYEASQDTAKQKTTELPNKLDGVKNSTETAENPAEKEKGIDSQRLETALSRSEKPIKELFENPDNFTGENLQTLQMIALRTAQSPSDVEEFVKEREIPELDQALASNREIMLKEIQELGMAA
jgi:hypothetical protein